MEEDLVNGSAASSTITATLDDPLEQFTETLVMDERLRRQRIITSPAHLIAGGADDNVPPGCRPTQALADRSRGIKKRPLYIGATRGTTDVRSHARRHVSQSFCNEGWPFHRWHSHAHAEGFADGATDRRDPFALPGGGQNNGDASEATRQQFRVNLQALLGRDVGLV